MKRPFGKTIPTFLVLFLAMFALTIATSFWAESLSRERAIFQVILSPETAEQQRPAVLNLADMGWLKRLVQPNRVTFTTGHRAGILNKIGNPVWIEFETSGFVGEATVEAHDVNWSQDEARFTGPLNPNEAFNISLELKIPRDRLALEQVDQGSLLIIDSQSGEVLTEVPIKVANSR